MADRRRAVVGDCEQFSPIARSGEQAQLRCYAHVNTPASVHSTIVGH